MKKSRTAVIALILVGQLSVPAQAQVIPGRWEKVATLAAGPRITVELKSGDRLEGQLEGLSPSELSLRTGSAQARIPRSDIKRIAIRGDGLLNGVLLGAAIGGGAMAGIAVPPEHDFSAGGIMVLTLAGIVGGALIGVGLDALTKTEVVRYQVP